MKRTIEHHGDSKRGPYHRLYRIWGDMKNRCSSPTCHAYNGYGGRGIKVCDEWANSYVAFKEWAIAHGYAHNLTIDRINVNGNYEPNNCRWATRSEQNINQRPKVTYEYNGSVYSLDDLVKISDIPRNCIYARIHKFHWSIDEAIHTPVGERRRALKWVPGEYPFDGYKIYVCWPKSQKCAIAVLTPSSDVVGKKTSMSYARYKMCVKEKRLLDPEEIVRHKDGDVGNDAFENLEIVVKS